MPGSAPLAGVRVLDLTRLLPGPVCTLYLADLGADVVKVEDIGAGDYARTLGNVPGRVSAFYNAVNRNKRSLALDLKDPRGLAVFLGLSRRADLIVESFRPGVMAKLGLAPEGLLAANAKLVFASISGYGQTGPRRDVAGHDINFLGYAGVLDQTGTRGTPPALSNLQIADLLGGAASGAIAILAALFDAQRHGTGRVVDVAMADAVLAHNVLALHALEQWGTVLPRGEDLLTGGVPCYGVYPTADDRWLAVGALEPKFWQTLCSLIGRNDLLAGQFARGAEGERVRKELERTFRVKTLSQWDAVFAAADCCVTPCLTLDEALVDPQFVAREMIVRTSDGARQYAPPFRLSRHRFELARMAPAQGEHSIEVLLEAGLSAVEIDALVTAAVVKSGDRTRAGA